MSCHFRALNGKLFQTNLRKRFPDAQKDGKDVQYNLCCDNIREEEHEFDFGITFLGVRAPSCCRADSVGQAIYGFAFTASPFAARTTVPATLAYAQCSTIKCPLPEPLLSS